MEPKKQALLLKAPVPPDSRGCARNANNFRVFLSPQGLRHRDRGPEERDPASAGGARGTHRHPRPPGEQSRLRRGTAR